MDSYHIPVLLQPVCALLQVHPGGIYIDATLGGGGHTSEIIRLGGKVLAIDQDPDSHQVVGDLPGLTKVLANFTHLEQIAKTHGVNQVDGILFDLGVSLHQLRTSQRGFSIQKDGPLDMRMDPSLPNSAATLVNQLPVSHLAQIFKDFGEVVSPKAIAERVVLGRPYTSTMQLVKQIGHKDLARKVFQALRIAVNDELNSLKTALTESYQLLSSSGRVAVISFHSLEERIVKNAFHTWQKQGLGKLITSKPISPSVEEIIRNPASHSAKLRVFQKI